MLAVISIHVSSTYLSYETGHLFLGMNLAFLLNQAARFSALMSTMSSIAPKRKNTKRLSTKFGCA